MENEPKISIIVPIYNAEKFIDRCMQSIYAQTFSDYEIILVNDGSNDQSDEICKKYQAQDDRITYIKKENEGAGSARNRGIEIAKGEYLAFPDVDDWFEPDMYAELYELAKSGNYDLVISGINYYNSTDSGSIEYSRSAVCKACSFHTMEECRENVMMYFPTSVIFDSPCNKLYKRSVALKNCVRFSNTRRCQDAMFNIEFYNSITSVISTDKAYYNYIENTVQSTNRKFPITYIDINVIYYTKLLGTLTLWGLYKGEIKQHYDTSFVIAVYGTMGMFENPVWHLDKKQQKKYVVDILERQDVWDKLVDADIREDAVWMFDIIKNKDYKEFIRRYRRERIKDMIRGNKVIIGVYRRIKNRDEAR